MGMLDFDGRKSLLHLNMNDNRLQELRMRAGKTLRQVGRETGMFFEYIRLFEKKLKVPDIKQKEALEKYYQTDLTDYFRVVSAVMLIRKARRLEQEAVAIIQEGS